MPGRSAGGTAVGAAPKVRGRGNPGKPGLRSGLAALVVVWNLYGFATGFFERAWAAAPIPVTAISYLLNAALVAALPFSRDRSRGAALALALLGALMALWSAAGVAFTRSGVALLGPLPAALGAGVPAVLGVALAAVGLRDYLRHGRGRAAGAA